MYCPKCGTENPDNAQTCTACGAALIAGGQARPAGETFDDELALDDPREALSPEDVPEIDAQADAGAGKAPEAREAELVQATVIDPGAVANAAPPAAKRSIKPKLVLALIVIVVILALVGACQAGCFKQHVEPAQVCTARAIDFKDGANMPDQKTTYGIDGAGNVTVITTDTRGAETVTCTYDDDGFLQYAYNESKTVEATAKNTGKRGKLESAVYTLGKIKINVDYTYNDNEGISGYTISSEGGLGTKAATVVQQLVPSSTLITSVAMQGGTATESFDEDGYLVSATFAPRNGSRGSAATYTRSIDEDARTMTVKVAGSGSASSYTCTLDEAGNVVTMVPANASGQISKVAYKWTQVEEPSAWASKMSHLKIG